jgi:NAD+-dependent protein deacetylase SIR2
MRENHCKLIASLAKKAVLAKPTPFHTLLQVLENGNKIQRIYTQNIDGLESKVGFDLLGSDFSAMRCVPLHGSLLQSRCTVCSARRPLAYNFHDLESGNLPYCGICKETNTKRGDKGLRLRTPGHLRPDIVLYDEEMEVDMGELIMTMASSDAENVSDGHVLLVVGTSLQIPGVAKIIKIIGSAVERVKGDVIYLNHNAPPPALANRFSIFVQGDCQRFAEAAITLLTEEKPMGSEEINYVNAVEQRRDMRPLWVWL